jgi:hypothetical protein
LLVIDGMEIQAPPTESADVLLPPDEQWREQWFSGLRLAINSPRIGLPQGRAAPLCAPTIADIEEIIQHSRKVIDDSHAAIRRVDYLLLQGQKALRH